MLFLTKKFFYYKNTSYLCARFEGRKPVKNDLKIKTLRSCFFDYCSWPKGKLTPYLFLKFEIMNQEMLNQHKRVTTDVPLDGFIVKETLATHLVPNRNDKGTFSLA